MFGYIKEFNDYYIKLLQLSDYDSEETQGSPVYDTEERNSGINLLREKYSLDEIAGTGDEVSQIINIMRFVDERITHGNEMTPDPLNAFDILSLAEQQSLKMNCYVIATVLTELYLSLGFSAKRIRCRAYDAYDLDSHVVTIVYSRSLNKWLYMDASWGIFITDEQGSLLGIEEFRARVSGNLPVYINGDKEDTEWSQFYKGYMSKNLFWFMHQSKDSCSVLLPKYFMPVELMMGTAPNSKTEIGLYRNPEHFWMTPAQMIK
ncbi:hypothetical protein M3231_10900 [Neobacillus mesonae]|nr:hypothetical protein [Neobacillus mesonae]